MGPPNHKQSVQLKVEPLCRPAAGQEVKVGKDRRGTGCGYDFQVQLASWRSQVAFITGWYLTALFLCKP